MPRFTSHGEVCFNDRSGGRLVHPFWGDFKQWWPGQPTPDTQTGNQQQGGCGGCKQAQQQQRVAPTQFATVSQWFDAIKKIPSDFNEHMDTLSELAARCKISIELSTWGKPALLAMVAGKPNDGKVISICPGIKQEWSVLQQIVPQQGFTPLRGESLAVEPIASDLLFIDTFHQANRLFSELERWAPLCSHYIVVHCTEIFGEKGDDGGEGVLFALRRWTRRNPHWSVIKHYPNNNGLTVLSCDPVDKPVLPSTARQVLNFVKAVAKYKTSGLHVLDEEKVEARLDVCAMCEMRVEERCSKCGCP